MDDVGAPIALWTIGTLAIGSTFSALMWAAVQDGREAASAKLRARRRSDQADASSAPGSAGGA